MKNILLAAFCAIVTASAAAQQVKDFTLTNVLNGEKVSLEKYPSCSGLLIVFTSNACPYDEYYRTRIKKIATTYQDQVPVLLVNSHTEPGESEENMKKTAQQMNLTLPYLADKDQSVMKQFGATKSPQVYLLKNVGGKFSIAYSGAIDDNAQVEADVRHYYLKDAIDIVLTNQTVATPEVRPVGCTIRKK